MPELYFNDGNFLPESREEEQSAETVLNIMLAGKTTDTEMCIWPCFYHAPMCKGVLKIWTTAQRFGSSLP